MTVAVTIPIRPRTPMAIPAIFGPDSPVRSEPDNVGPVVFPAVFPVISSGCNCFCCRSLIRGCCCLSSPSRCCCCV